MNTRAAIDETMTTLKSGIWHVTHADEMHDEHIGHLYEMWDKISADHTMSDGKLNRWLGWMQAVIVILTDATLEEMKQINKKWAD